MPNEFRVTQPVTHTSFRAHFKIKAAGILGIPVSSASVKHRLKQSFQAVFFYCPNQLGQRNVRLLLRAKQFGQTLACPTLAVGTHRLAEAIGLGGRFPFLPPQHHLRSVGTGMFDLLQT